MRRSLQEMNVRRGASPSPNISFLRDTKTVGELSELIVAMHLAQAGYLVSKPLGENQRYDLIIDDGNALYKVQVKTGRFRNGAVEWNCCSTHGHRGGPSTKPYFGQIDFFGVYCPQTRTSYLVPIVETSRRLTSLRVYPAKNSQLRKVRWAKKYLIPSEPFEQLVLVGAGDDAVVTGLSSPMPS